MDNIEKKNSSIFNSPLEIGFRILIVLDSFYPKSLDLTYLTWFDHLVINSADFGGDSSLHPKIPFRVGEILVKRNLIKAGLDLMVKYKLVHVINSHDGILYQASDESNFVVDLISSEYGQKLKERAVWLLKNFGEKDFHELKRIIENKLGKWNVEFQSSYNDGV